MTSKVKMPPPKIDIGNVGAITPEGKARIFTKRQRTLDKGYMDQDTPFELPDGASPLLYDVRFENGGVRKDFGLTNMGTICPTRVADIAHYAYVHPTTHEQINRIVRIYRGLNGHATIDFWDGADWSGAVVGEVMEDVLVHATTIQGMMAFADGERIHVYEEAKTDLVYTKTDFDVAGGTGSGPSKELIAEGEYHTIVFPDAADIQDGKVKIRWKVEAVKGAGVLKIRLAPPPIPGPGGPVELEPMFEKDYIIKGANVWPFEEMDVSAFWQLGARLSIVQILPLFPLPFGSAIQPEVKVKGFVEAEDGAAGGSYFVLTDPETVFRTEGPPASYVFSFEDRLIAVGGKGRPDHIAGSKDGDPREWRLVDETNALTGAFDYPILDSITEPVEDMIAGGKVADNIAAVVRKRSIMRLQETGEISIPVAVNDWIDGIGSESPKSITQVPDGICFLGHNLMPYYFTGEQEPIPIGKHIYQKMVESLQLVSLPFVECKYDDNLNEWWIGIPEDGGTGITGWWIFDLGKFLVPGPEREMVWRYKPVTGITACLPAPASPPTGGEEPPEPEEEFPPPETEPETEPYTFELEGLPFEIEYADGAFWIGYTGDTSRLVDMDGDGDPDTLANIWAEAFNASTGESIKECHSLVATNITKCEDMGYIPERKEMWMNGLGKLQVWDTTTFALKATHTPSGFSGVDDDMMYCPGDGLIYSPMHKSASVGAVGFDPATGVVVTVSEKSEGSPSGRRPEELLWIPSLSRILVIHRNWPGIRLWSFSPTAPGSPTAMELVSSVEGSDLELEGVYNPDDGKIYYIMGGPLITSVNVLRWTPTSNGLPGGVFETFKSFSDTDSSPRAQHLEYVPTLKGIAVSRHNGHGTGIVVVYDKSGNILRSFFTDFGAERLAYCASSESLAVLSDFNEFWQEDFKYAAAILPLGGTANVPSPAPEVPRGNPSPPGTTPAPTPTPEPDPTPPPAGAPTITAARDFCTNNLVEAPAGTWNGTIDTGVEVDYTGDLGSPIQIRAVPPGTNPTTINWHAPGTVTFPSAGKVRLRLFIHTAVNASVATKPMCNPPSRDKYDTFWDVYLRRDLGGGTYSSHSNKVTVRVLNPKPFFDVEPPTPLPDPGDLVAPSITGTSQVTCSKAPQPGSTPTNWSGRVLQGARIEVFHGNNPIGIPIEILEFNEDDVPGVDTPLRRVMPGSNSGNYITVEQTLIVYDYTVSHVNEPVCNLLGIGTSPSVPPLTRDYYARLVVGDGEYSPLSSRKRFTFYHPGPQ